MSWGMPTTQLACSLPSPYLTRRKHVGCYVSVGHRMQLLQHHTHVLECVGGGEWRFSTVAEYAARAGMGGTLGLHHHHHH